MNPKPGITLTTLSVILTYTGSSLPSAKSHLNFPFLISFKMICPGPKLYIPFHNTLHFYGEELLHHCSTPKLKDEPLLTFHDCSFNTFAVTLHIWWPSSPPAEDTPCRINRDPFNMM